MIRLRKYRIFLAVTLCCLLAVYFFSKGSPQYLPDKYTGFNKPQFPQQRPSQDTLSKPSLDNNVAAPGEAPVPPHPVATTAPEPNPPIPPLKPQAAPQEVNVPEKPTPVENPEHHAPLPLDPNANKQGVDSTTTTTSSSAADSPTPDEHWTPKHDSFPVPSESLIQLPTGAPKAIPRIQYVFKAETAAEKADRESKLDAVKASITRTWNGYRQYAWMKDELRPNSGGYKSKFGGWAATLVDSLDTLWIAGMKEEFEEAVEAASKIDFKTSDRADIPMFETTIRYLGGFLGAYDVSGGAYKVLLDKAVELAEVLMGAFDTPNRMPILYYSWAGNRSSNPISASSSAVLAEIGSLSVEFTRLAQLTENTKYYDAIARITNELEIFQSKTEVPGLWPLHLDISGCGLEGEVGVKPKHTGTKSTAHDLSPENGPNPLKDTSTFGTDRESAIEQPPTTLTEDDRRQKDKTSFADEDAERRSDGEKESDLTTGGLNRRADDGDDDPDDGEGDDCPPGGFQSSSGSTFSIGGEADSTYEYLPKEYLLLGGLNDQYRNMYIDSVESIKEHLLYRPMIEDEKRELLFTGKFRPTATAKGASGPITGSLDTSLGHLTCFQGGMFALAGKIFDRKAELDMAWKLADGCVWAYESSASGVMPEDITPVKCDTLVDCPWNQTAWWLALDPAAATRSTKPQQAQKRTESSGMTVDAYHDAVPRAQPITSDVEFENLTKRQAGETELVDEDEEDDDDDESPVTTATDADTKHPSVPGLVAQPPPSQLTHEEFVKKRIANQGLWPGLQSIGSTNYILRPEAIESVWYMYRITGDDYWRQKGWKMFQAVEKATKVAYGNSAIRNVASKNIVILDEMESFWMAETLKYFYLLFSEPDLISLDDYVLNTEAHPFLRPDSQKKPT